MELKRSPKSRRKYLQITYDVVEGIPSPGMSPLPLPRMGNMAESRSPGTQAQSKTETEPRHLEASPTTRLPGTAVGFCRVTGLPLPLPGPT